MPDYGTGSFIIANIADANLVPGIAWVSGDCGTRYGDQSPAPFLRAAIRGSKSKFTARPSRLLSPPQPQDWTAFLLGFSIRAAANPDTDCSSAT